MTECVGWNEDGHALHHEEAAKDMAGNMRSDWSTRRLLEACGARIVMA